MKRWARDEKSIYLNGGGGSYDRDHSWHGTRHGMEAALARDLLPTRTSNQAARSLKAANHQGREKLIRFLDQGHQNRSRPSFRIALISVDPVVYQLATKCSGRPGFNWVRSFYSFPFLIFSSRTYDELTQEFCNSDWLPFLGVIGRQIEHYT